MSKHYWDFETGEYCISASGNMMTMNNGNLLMKISDNMAIDLASGEVHFIYSSGLDDDDFKQFQRQVMHKNSHTYCRFFDNWQKRQMQGARKYGKGQA